MPPPALDVSAALIVRDGKYLVTQRREGDSFGGYWELPGGKKEPGETMEQCVVREIAEELGVEIAPVRFFRLATYPYPQRTVRLHIYLCRLKKGEPKPIECQAVEWSPPKRLPSYKFPDADLSLVHELSKVDPETLFDPLPYPAEYLEGIRLFNRGSYFDAHEVWEAWWHRAGGDEKEFAQSLIHAAVALKHLKDGNRAGFTGQAEKALSKWGSLPGEFCGLNLEMHWVQWDALRKAVASGEDVSVEGISFNAGV